MSFVLDLHAERRGSGPAMLLTHGGVGSWRHWTRNLDRFAEHFTVIAADLPGFGDSPSIDKHIPPEDYLAVSDASLMKLVEDFETVNIVAFSFGTVIGSHLATTMGERVRKLSLVSPGGLASIRIETPPFKKMPGPDAPEAEVREVVRHNLLQQMLKHPESVTDETIDIQLACIERTRFGSYRVSLRDVLVDYLKGLKAPMQVVLGEFDTVIYPDHRQRFEKIREAVPEFREDIIAEAGHWMQYERPKATEDAILDFLLAD